jgi:hypothetical protein
MAPQLAQKQINSKWSPKKHPERKKIVFPLFLFSNKFREKPKNRHSRIHEKPKYTPMFISEK